MTISTLKYFSRQFIVLLVFIDFSRIIRHFHILKAYFSSKKKNTHNNSCDVRRGLWKKHRGYDKMNKI